MKRLLLGALLLAGCTGQRLDYTFFFQGPQEDLPYAVSYAEAWNRCGIVRATVTQDRGTPVVEAVVLPKDPASGLEMNGYTWVRSGTPELIVYKQGQIIAVLHEMGHAFGLPHYGDGLMSPTENVPEVRAEDCAMLAKEKGL